MNLKCGKAQSGYVVRKCKQTRTWNYLFFAQWEIALNICHFLNRNESFLLGVPLCQSLICSEFNVWDADYVAARNFCGSFMDLTLFSALLAI